jgi:hypothetical protein
MAIVTDRNGNPVTDGQGNAVRTQATNAAAQISRATQEASVENFVGSAVTWGKNLFNTATEAVGDFVDDITEPFKFASKSRSKTVPSTESPTAKAPAQASFSATTETDWRVRLSIPPQFPKDGLLAPLTKTKNSFMFPLTPSIIISHSAHYNALQPVHTNYPFQIYENSSTDDMTLTGEFPVQNAADGQYWVACIHYLRSITKMFYGYGDDSGSPPPVVKLNGYGDYIFKNVPVVITNFTVDLPVDVDYIAVPLTTELADFRPGQEQIVNSSGTTWVPTLSQITITVRPTYSRSKVSEFSLENFVNGAYVIDGKGFI